MSQRVQEGKQGKERLETNGKQLRNVHFQPPACDGKLDRGTVAGVAVRTVYSDGHLRNRCHALWDRECVCTRVWSSTVPCWPWTFSALNGPGASAGWILTSDLRGDVDQHASSRQPKLPCLPCSTCEWHWQIYSWLCVRISACVCYWKS